VEFTSKKYKIIKTKNYIKLNSLFIFFNGINQNSNDWILIEQNLKKINFNYYKIFNKTSKKALTNSVFVNMNALINSITFLLKPISIKNEITKQTLLNSFEPLLFTLLSIKLNNKIYSKAQLKNLFSFNYTDNKLLFFQFKITNTKIIFKKK